MLSMHLRQLTRKPARIVIFILILVLLTAFFCVSLNLYANSMYNLKLADETYTTIAIMELYADVDTHGNLIDDITNVEDYAGFHALTVYGYDLEPIVTAPRGRDTARFLMRILHWQKGERRRYLLTMSCGSKFELRIKPRDLWDKLIQDTNCRMTATFILPACWTLINISE